MFQRIALHLTDRCQLDCDHCLRDPAASVADLPLSVVAAVVEEARVTYGIRHVSLTGGEPCLHPEFESVLDTIAERGCLWDMVTNGKRFPWVMGLCDEGPHRRETLRSVTFSLDGAKERTHDGIRGRGSYAEVLAAASLAGLRGVPFGVQMAVNARNEPELEDLALLAAELGAKHVSFAMTQPTGTHLDAELFLPAARWRDVRRRVEALSRSLRITVVLPEGYPRDEVMASCGPMRGETLHVDVAGRLSLCCLHSGIPRDAGAEERDVAGPVSGGLVAAHRRLLDIIHDAQAARLEALGSGRLEGQWKPFLCNWCLGHFGKPHWTDRGAAGAGASRERWQSGRRRLVVVNQ